MRPVHPNFRTAAAAKDSPIRTLCEAQAEARSDILRTKADLQSADGFTARSHDFTAGNVLDAAAETAEVTLSNAPAGNHLYEAHYKVSIDPVIPGAGTNTHKVVVAVETDLTGGGTWVEQWAFEYELITKVGEPDRVVEWKSERLIARVPSLTSSSKLRLKVKSASGPGGWSFAVHGFNLATDADLLSGVTYHTGPAIDFLDGGGASLADTVLSKISHATSDGYETDLGGPALSPDVAPFIVARTVWGASDSNDIAIDRFTAQLHPKQDGGQPKDVVWFICQPYALRRSGPVGSQNAGALTELLTDLVPLCDPVRVPAGDGTSAQDYVFSFYDRTQVTPGGTIVTMLRKPRPKSIRPEFVRRDGNGNLSTAPEAEYDGSPTTFWFIWAVKADGSPATNVGWARDSATTEVVNGSRKLRTVQVRRLLDHWYVEGPSVLSATARPVFRCKIECGSYAAANLEYTAGGNQLDFGATPTETVEFVAVAAVPDGTGSVFEVRNDADSAWLPFTDGQTAAEVGVSQREEYKVRWRGSPNSQGDATPVLWEIGVRDVKKVWLSDLIASIRAKWHISNVAELVPNIPEAEIVLIKNGEQDFNDRVTKLLSTNTIGSLAFRVWRGDPARPRSEWLHKDDFALLDDYEPGNASVTILAHSPLVFVNGALPVYNTTTQKREPLQLANKTPKQVYEEIVNNQLAPDVPARYRGEPLTDESCLISQTLQDSDGLTELNAIQHIAGQVLSTQAGKLKSFPMFGPGAIQAIFPSEKIKWRSTAPGLRQRVPRFFVKYDYDASSGSYRGEARLISGNDILATNLKPSRIDADPNLRDDVCRWIPVEELAKRVGQRRVDTLGAGMLVWGLESSSEPHDELEFGDVVAVETDRFFARDPSQTAQRTLKGALWALGRIVAYDLDAREFGIWIQSYTDIFGGSDAAARVGFGAPQPILSITIDFSDVGAATATIQCDATAGSIKFVGRKSGFPSLADVQATTAVDGRNVSAAIIDAATGSAMVMSDGDICYLSAVAYTKVAAGGEEGPLAQGRGIFPFKMRRLILTSGSSFSVPADWNNSRNTVEGIGGAGGGSGGTANTRGGGGGGGGEFRRVNNVALTPGAAIPYVIGAAGGGGAAGADGVNGGDTTFNTSTLIAKGGLKGVASTGVGGAGGAGGTGAGGNFNGGTGGNGTVGTGNRTGGGGGGGGGTTAAGSNGGNGGAPAGGTGGAGGAASGGAQVAGDTPGNNGTVWSSSDGAGSGGGGGSSGSPGQTGGQWGGGGGGGSSDAGAGYAGAAGKHGVLVITWWS